MRYDAILPRRGLTLPAVLLTVLRFLIVLIQMTALMAFFIDHLGWGLLLGTLSAVATALFLPLVATVLAMIGAIKVWAWPWWAAMLVFLPGLALSLTAIAGVGAAGLLSALFFRRLRAQQRSPRDFGGPGTAYQPGARHEDRSGGDTIEGEVISSRVDDSEPRR